MKIFFVLIMLTLLGALGLTRVIEQDAGYILIAYKLVTLEMSLWVGLFALAVSFAALYFLLRLMIYVAAPQGAVQHWFSDRRQRRTQQLTTLGLLAFAEGNWDKSRKVLAKAAERSDTPLLNYLIAARASQALGAKEQSEDFLRKAGQNADGSKIAIDLTQAELQLENGQLEEGLATLMRLRKAAPKHPVILKLLLRAYEGLQDWKNLQKLLPELRKQKLFNAEEYSSLQERVYCSILRAAAQNKTAHSMEELSAVWQKFPSTMQKDNTVVLAYVEALMGISAHPEAEKILRISIKREWDNRLVACYGRVKGKDVDKQLLLAESWLKPRPNNAGLLLCLGRLALMNQLWGKAREYFQMSLKLDKNAEAYAELGRLLANLGEHEKSTEYYQRGLLLSTHDLPDLPMPHKSAA